MIRGMRILAISFCFVAAFVCLRVQAQESLPGTARLEASGDMSARMVAGIDRFLMRETQNSVKERQKYWKRDFSSADAYQKSIEANRERLRKMIGAVDPRIEAPVIEFVQTTE